MKLLNPFLLCICIVLVLYYAKKEDSDSNAFTAEDPTQTYTLIVDRGAFQYDKFVLTSSQIEYHPDPKAQFENSNYNTYSVTKLDSVTINSFFKEIEEKGFSELHNSYVAYASCSSELKITLI